MVYRVEPSPKASSQIFGLPKDAFNALVEAMSLVREDPYGAATDPTPFALTRRIVFDGGLGLATYVIQEDVEFVLLDDVTWIG